MIKKFGFVVLNYHNYEESFACVDSILEICDEDYFVVVVDNDSPNNSFLMLSARYEGHPKVKVLHSGRNGGYSYGNNFGIKYLTHMGIRDVIIATSDTVVRSKDILQQFRRIDADDLGVVGPQVRDLNNDNQNPMLARVNLPYILNIHYPAAAAFLRNLVYKLRPSLKKKIWSQKENAREEAAGGDVYMVHGCFLYLTRHYLEKCGNLDETLFMYGEEDLLAYTCRQHGLRTVYLPQVLVLHKDAASTPKENNNSFTVTNSRLSMKYLKRVLRPTTLFLSTFRN
jgi:GT2 family glycosyltransferase